MPRTGIRKTALSLAVAAAFAGSVSQAHASSFALIEQNASGLGNSYAGAAAAAEDASTIFFNPAGMSLLPSGSQIVGGVALIRPSIKFSDGGSVAALATPLGSTGGDAGSLAAVPNFYFAMDLVPNWKAGIGVSVPFGLKTEYSSDWMGRFQAIKSDIQTLNINPSVSYKLSDTTSLGFGLSYQTIDAELTRAFNNVTVPPNTPGEGTTSIKGSDGAWGYNLGAMFQLAPETRLGVSYRSQIKYHITGPLTFTNTPLPNGNESLYITMPDSLSFALSHRIDSKWTLLGDLTWTGWSKIQQLNITFDNGLPASVTPENFKNTWRAGVGATYRYSDDWSIKMGAAYDQTPVNNTDRTPRLPDQNRLWLSVGGQHRLSSATTLDFGYAHLFLKDAPIDQDASATGNGHLVGTYRGSIDILGVQFAYRF
ncbi:MAG TPA: outer membrane protein transport protein [Burkholderiales bacterium]